MMLTQVTTNTKNPLMDKKDKDDIVSVASSNISNPKIKKRLSEREQRVLQGMIFDLMKACDKNKEKIMLKKQQQQDDPPQPITRESQRSSTSSNFYGKETEIPINDQSDYEIKSSKNDRRSRSPKRKPTASEHRRNNKLISPTSTSTNSTSNGSIMRNLSEEDLADLYYSHISGHDPTIALPDTPSKHRRTKKKKNRRKKDDGIAIDRSKHSLGSFESFETDDALSFAGASLEGAAVRGIDLGLNIDNATNDNNDDNDDDVDSNQEDDTIEEQVQAMLDEHIPAHLRDQFPPELMRAIMMDSSRPQQPSSSGSNDNNKRNQSPSSFYVDRLHNIDGIPDCVDVQSVESMESVSVFTATEKHNNNSRRTVDTEIESFSMSKSIITKKKNKNLKVSFHQIHVRHYEQILECNPACRSGPPIGLDWLYSQGETIDVVDNDHKKGKLLLLTRREREQLLLEWGYTQAQIATAMRKVRRIKNQRKQTINNLSAAGVEEAVEQAKRKLLSVLRLVK